MHTNAVAKAHQQVVINEWQILKILLSEDPREISQYCFAGRDTHEKRFVLSNYIDFFDSKSFRGITKTGHVYHVTGAPYQVDPEKKFQWLDMVLYQDATAEFLGMHGLTIR